MPSQQILEQKTSEVEEIKELLKAYKYIGIASLQKVRAAQLQELKKSLKGKVYMRVLKNTLTKFAIDSMEDENIKKLDDYLEGANLFMFTDINPFKLSLLLERGKVKTTAKSGDLAAMDVIIPEGSTGQPPGPIISQLNAVGLPTRIESGSVWVSKDTLVVKKGEPIGELLAALLSKLGIKAVEAGLTMKVVLDENLIITGDQLKVDVEETRKLIQQNSSEAFALTLTIAYPTSENITTLLQIAHKESYALALNATIPTKETIEDIIRKAHTQMLNVNNKAENNKPKE